MFQKRGIFFTIDALLASGILLIAVVLASTFYVNQPETEHVSFLAQDTIEVYSNVKIKDVESGYVDELITNGDITDQNNTVLVEIARLWEIDKKEEATNLSYDVAVQLIPKRFGVGVYIEDEALYESNKSITRALVTSSRLISGITNDTIAKPWGPTIIEVRVWE